jgi:hypothetical protein
MNVAMNKQGYESFRNRFKQLNGDFETWVERADSYRCKTTHVNITEIGQEENHFRLNRVGFDNLIGHLEGGFEAWKKAEKKLIL